THNSMGRSFAASSGPLDNLAELSCRNRALRDCLRVLLASIVYRSEHGGALPATSQGLVLLLGAWPQDPFSGRPMIYNPKKEVVYSVGKDLR
ncbi:hypothetical protein ABTL61_19425, partial [Acinetobacter baumannii]